MKRKRNIKVSSICDSFEDPPTPTQKDAKKRKLFENSTPFGSESVNFEIGTPSADNESIICGISPILKKTENDCEDDLTSDEFLKIEIDETNYEFDDLGETSKNIPRITQEGQFYNNESSTKERNPLHKSKSFLFAQNASSQSEMGQKENLGMNNSKSRFQFAHLSPFNVDRLKLSDSQKNNVPFTPSSLQPLSLSFNSSQNSTMNPNIQSPNYDNFHPSFGMS